MSCIYGPHQCGTEDQGWVAHFALQVLQRKPITIFGDGRQVRDILFIDDLVDAFLLAKSRAPAIAGRAFNIGGGPDRATSLLELIRLVGQLDGIEPELRFEDWRIGDQRYYVSDTRTFEAATGWKARVNLHDGVARLLSWLGAADVPQERCASEQETVRT
jgi:CDP-paratose 2-epimerase